MAADRALQDSVDHLPSGHLEQVSYGQIIDDINSCESDFHVEDYTDRTNSIVIALSDADIYETVKLYLTDNYSFNHIKNRDGIIIKTLHQNLNVIVTAYNTTKKFHIQGKGCKGWWNNIFLSIIKDLVEQTKAQWPASSTPKPCCVNSLTELKQLAETDSANRNHSAMAHSQSNDCHSVHQLSSPETMQSRISELEEMNNSYKLQISSNADSLNRAKDKLRSFISISNKTLPILNDNIQLNDALKEENVLLREQIAQMRSVQTANRSEIKLLAQDRKNLVETLRQANDQCDEQVATLSALMDQLAHANQPTKRKMRQPHNDSECTIQHVSSTNNPDNEIKPKLTTDNSDVSPNHQMKVPIKPTKVLSVDHPNEDTYHGGRTLLIGSSILKLVNKRGLSGDVDVRSIRGGILPDIGNALLNMDILQYETIVIHAGGNDASQGESLRDIIYEYESILNVIFSQNSDIKVLVSELTPRRDVNVTSLNQALKQFCDQCSLRFIENYVTTRCDQKSIHRDGIHLTNYGTTQLLKNIHCFTSILKYGDRSSFNSTVHRDSSCFYCGEPGHVTKVCRHGSPVKCWVCGLTGHKSKMCQKAEYI